MRLFFAIWPSADVALQLAQAASQLQLAAPGRLVNPRSAHLTLAFIGEATGSQLSEVLEIGRAQRASCCNILFDSLEYWQDPAVVVAAARENPAALLELSRHLHEASRRQADASSLGPPWQWRAHVTLARKVSQAPVLPVIPPIVWRAQSFSLASSDTRGAQSVYTVVETWPLLYER